GNDIHSPPVEHQRVAAGNLDDWGASLGLLPPEKILVIDPERGRFWFRTPPASAVWVPVYHYGFSGDIGAGTYDRRDSIETNGVISFPNGGDTEPGPVPFTVPAAPVSGVFQFTDSKTYLASGDITGITAATLQAADFQRPYIKRITGGPLEWVFK